MLSEAVKKELSIIVGDGNVSFSREDLLCYSYDATNSSYLPDAVVFPENAEHVSLIFKVASFEGIPVIPRGAGSGFSGGSLPVEGGIVVSTERMRRIINIDAANMVATVEPGVVTGVLQQEVEELGLFYPPDPASLRFSTIGGNIAECAGGPRGVKYGVTRDYVLGLEAVLPTGEIINTGTRTLKGVVGYDLTRLIVGSEGTLAFVTRAYLRLISKPEKVGTMLAVFPSLDSAALASSRIMESGVVPSTLEIIDRVCIECVAAHGKDVIEGAEGAEAILLIEVDGDGATVSRDSDALRAVCLEAGASRVRTAETKREVKALWRARRSISPALTKVKPNKLNEDVVVPRASLAELIGGVHRIGTERGVLIASFGHAGDGNLHVNVMIDASDEEERGRGEAAVRDIFTLTLALGGTISGEHGVGTAKAPYLEMELSEDVMALTRRLKAAFDPRGVLNPGKMKL